MPSLVEWGLPCGCLQRELSTGDGSDSVIAGSMMVELEEKVSQLESWTEGKGLIVCGAGGTFCSGSDLNAVRAISNPHDGMKMCMFMQNTLTRLLRSGFFLCLHVNINVE